MKKVLLIATAIFAVTACFAQSKVKAEPMKVNKHVTQYDKAVAPVKHELGKAELKSSITRRGQKEGVFYARPEGTYWVGGKVNGVVTKYSIVPPFTELKYLNVSNDKTTGKWTIGQSETELDKYVDAENNLIFSYDKPSYEYVSYCPVLKDGEQSFQMADYVYPLDSVPATVYPFNYADCTRYYGFEGGGSAFMSGADAFDFDGDGNPEVFYPQFRQYFEKPATALNLHEVILWATTADKNFDASKLKLIFNKVVYMEREGRKFRAIGEKFAEMTCSAEMEDEYLDPTVPVYPGTLTFANMQKDEFGTEEAVPVVIDEEFAITIVGTEDPTIDVRFYFCDQGDYPEEFYTWATPTYILPLDAQGNSLITEDMNPNGLSYYNIVSSGPYCYNIAFIFYGEMDGINVETSDKVNEQIAPVAGGETESAIPEGKQNGYPAYVWTNYPFYEQDGEEYIPTDNYDFEGLPEWAQVSVDPTYYEYGRDTDDEIRGLQMIWFTVEALPEGQKGRSATVNIVSSRGAKANAPLYILQGDAEAPSGVKAVKFDAKGKYVGTYNMMGQQVDANAKGLIIRDGKKFVIK